VKAFNAFYDLLMPELPGIQTAMLDLQLVAVAREFCEKTNAWRATFDPVNLVAGQADYDLEPSESQSEAVRLERLTLNDCLLWDRSWNCDKPDDAPPKYRNELPPFTIDTDLLTLTLIADEIQTADAAGGLVAMGSMKPKVGATQLPDFLLGVHSEPFRYGVLARLLRMGKKPWTDLGLSGFYDGKYQQALNYAANNAQQGNTRGPLRTRAWG
jgi:hypothetical protein